MDAILSCRQISDRLMNASKVNHLIGTSALHVVQALFAKPLQEPVEILRLTRS